MANQQTEEQEVTAPVKPVRNAEIDAHPMLDRAQRAMCKVMRNAEGKGFRMFDYARIALGAAASDYANADDDDIRERVVTERALHHAALLFVYEALKACDHDIITEMEEFPTALQFIEELNTLGIPH